MFKKIITYVIGIFIPLIVGFLASFLTRENMNVYDTIIKPLLAPPGIVFPIAWSILYVLMGISSVMIFRSELMEKDKNQAYLLYFAQLIFNFFWSLIFFNKQAFLISFIWLVILWILIIAMIISFRKINKTSAYLQIPYLLWVTFAGYLNLSIYLLNK